MLTEPQIRQQLFAFLDGESSQAELEGWLEEHSWNLHRDSSRAAQKLVAAIELPLFEYEAGHLSDAELHEELLAIASTAEFSVVVRENTIELSDASSKVGFGSHRQLWWSPRPARV